MELEEDAEDAEDAEGDEEELEEEAALSFLRKGDSERMTFRSSSVGRSAAPKSPALLALSVVKKRAASGGR
jgi:hypothetical protein